MRIKQDQVSRQTGGDLVVAKLKVSLLDSLHWIAELVLVEIDNLSQGDQVRSQSEKF